MKRLNLIPSLALVVCSLAGPAAEPLRAHNGLTVGHSPPALPQPGITCPTAEPLRLFLLDDPMLGGPLILGSGIPLKPGTASILNPVSITAILARPENGGFVFSSGVPGFHFVDAANACHAMTTAFTGGAPFVVRLQRTFWPSAAQMGLVDEFGNFLLTADGSDVVFGNQTGAHFHPVWLMRRPGRYFGEFQVTSNHFGTSMPFTLQVASSTCMGAVSVDMTGVFNADVVDSGAGETLWPFDGNGHYWLLDGVYGTDRGLPANGRLDVFQLGGPGGAGLAGANRNVLLDDGSNSSAALINLQSTQQDGQYLSVEVLLGASGEFTSDHVLWARMQYTTGPEQLITIRRSPTATRFFPLHDWQIGAVSRPELSVGRRGDGTAGFVRSDGTGVDPGVVPPDSMFFQRVTFPVDRTRTLLNVGFLNYTGAGRVGIFAMSLIRAMDHKSDANGDGIVDLLDWTSAWNCFDGPGSTRREVSCATFDVECDGDIDLRDIARFQNDLDS